MEYKQVVKYVTIGIVLDKYTGLDEDNITHEHVNKLANDVFNALRRFADKGEVEIFLREMLPDFEIIEEE